MISVKSRKAKGRRLQNWVRDTLLSLFPKLSNEDVYCAIMGERGVDIKLSRKAQKIIPYAIECKNKQSLKQFRNNLLRDDELTPQEKFELYYDEHQKEKFK